MTHRTLFATGLLLLAVGSTASLSRPVTAAAFDHWPAEWLSVNQRDFRVFNNFQDPGANDNTVEHPNFPGQTGAVLAIWKAHAEWGSVPRAGNGLGDGIASNPVLGDGGANFDNSFQGTTSLVGGTNDKIHSTITSGICGGGTFGWTETPISDGWRIRYCEDWLWSDGPGKEPGPVTLMDLQGHATHQVGHSLGLGHSTAAGSPTMAVLGFGSGIGLRSIEADDIAGVQAIYGVALATKVRIDALVGSYDVGSNLQIIGANFDATANEVWFKSSTADGTPAKLLNVPSTAGGTQIDVVIPAGVGPGEVLVRKPSGNAGLSNAFPIDAAGPPGHFELTGPGLGQDQPNGNIPQLTGLGDLSPGGVGFTLDIQLVKANVAGVMFAGPGEGNVPFKGGVFDPVPILLQFPISVDANGNATLAAAMPASTPAGLELVLQAWFANGGGPQGATGTNGLRLVVP